MFVALLSRLGSRRRLVVAVLLCGAATLCAPLLQTRISPVVYLAAAAASALVSTLLLATSFYRVDAVRDYAQLPSRTSFPLSLALAQIVLVLVETILPTATFALLRRELTPEQLADLALVTVAGCAGVVWLTAAGSAARRVGVLAALAAAVAGGTGLVLLAQLPVTVPLALLAAGLLVALGRITRIGALPTRGAGADLPRGAGGNYFWRLVRTERVIVIDGLGIAALAAAFTVSSWSSGLHLPMAFGLLAVNAPLSTMISADPDLRRQLAMLGHPRLIARQYATVVACCLAPLNIAAAVGYWALGATQLVGLAVLTALATAVDALGMPLLERWLPLRGVTTPRDAWRHPRKYLLPGLLILAAGLVPLT